VPLMGEGEVLPRGGTKGGVSDEIGEDAGMNFCNVLRKEGESKKKDEKSGGRGGGGKRGCGKRDS